MSDSVSIHSHSVIRKTNCGLRDIPDDEYNSDTIHNNSLGKIIWPRDVVLGVLGPTWPNTPNNLALKQQLFGIDKERPQIKDQFILQ